jgi:hypothetical protein
MSQFVSGYKPGEGLGVAPLLVAGGVAVAGAGAAYNWWDNIKGYFGITDTLPNNPKLNRPPIAPGYGYPNIPESVAREEMVNWSPDDLATATYRTDAIGREYEQYLRDISGSGDSKGSDDKTGLWLLLGGGLALILLLKR